VSDAKFLLEHFYYGSLVHDGKPKDDVRLLGSSSGISTELVEKAIERIELPPLPKSDNGSWALVRGRHAQMPFLIIQSQLGASGQTTSHYVIAPANVLKSLGGNLNVLSAVIEKELPVFDRLVSEMPPLEIPQSGPPSVEEQIDDILELMMVTKNRTNLIEPLLAAIVQGQPLVIQNAPEDITERITFMAGILALLPPSTRFGVTFATHNPVSAKIHVQIGFSNDAQQNDDAVIFDWAKAKVSGKECKDEYSRFVMSQLRLDTELVIQRNAAMAPIAGWRINQGDKLADALAYASLRLKLDDGLRNNQPVNKGDVAKVLADDPTLTDKMSLLYVDHFIKLSLAMKDMELTESIAPLLGSNQTLKQPVLQQMEAALKDDLSWLIYDTLAGWVAHEQGPKDPEWIRLTHRVTLAYLKELVVDEDTEEINLLLTDMQLTGTGVHVADIIHKIVELLIPLFDQDSRLAENLFLLSVKYLDVAHFQELMELDAFRSRLPQPVRRVWALIVEETVHGHPSKLLVQMARSFGPEWEPDIMLRFAEVVCREGKFELLETPAIASLLELARLPKADTYADRLLSVVSIIEQGDLNDLKEPGPFILLQIRLLLADYEGLAHQMATQSLVLYPEDRQEEYLKMVERLFTDNAIPGNKVLHALQTLNFNGIKSAPFIIAAICSIRNHSNISELDAIAEQVCELFHDSPFLLNVVSADIVQGLVKYYSGRQDLVGITKITELVAVSAARMGSSGSKMIVDAYRQMNWSNQARAVGLEVLRSYARYEEDDKLARKVIAYFGKNPASKVYRSLEVTYTIKRLMSAVDIVTFTEKMHTTVKFLMDTATLYEDGKRTPSASEISSTLGTLLGGLKSEERKALPNNLLAMSKTIITLNKRYNTDRGRDENKHVERLLKREIDPVTALDTLWVISGCLGRARRSSIKFSKVIYPLEGRSTQELFDEVAISRDILSGLLYAFPEKNPIKLTVAEIVDELKTLREGMETDEQAELMRQLSLDMQYLVSLIAIIVEKGDSKAVEDSNLGKNLDSGKQSPKSALEFYRFLYGFYSKQ
jgi:hypothetical protein